MQPPSSKPSSMLRKPQQGERELCQGAVPASLQRCQPCAGIHGGHCSAKASSELCPLFPQPHVLSFLAAGGAIPGRALLLCRKPQPCGGAHYIAVADGVPLMRWDGAKIFFKFCLCRNYPIHKERFLHLPLSPLHKKCPVLLSCPSPTPLGDPFPSTNTTQPQQGQDLDLGFPLPGRGGIMM